MLGLECIWKVKCVSDMMMIVSLVRSRGRGRGRESSAFAVDDDVAASSGKDCLLEWGTTSTHFLI